MNLKELIGKAEKILAELTALQSKLATEANEEAKKTIQTELETKSAEFDKTSKQIEVAKDLAKKQNDLIEAKKLTEPVVAGKTIVGDDKGEDKAVLEAKKHEEEETAKREAFIQYCQGKTISDKMHDLMVPQSTAFKQGKEGIVMPRSLAAKIFGQNIAGIFGKATNPLLSSGDGAGLVPQEYINKLLQLPSAPPEILSKVTFVPTSTGEVTYPSLVQTDANEYGGVSFEWIDEGGEKKETEPSFTQIAIKAYECAGYTEISHRMLSRSAIPLEALLTSLFRSAMQDEMCKKILTGGGIGEPTGIINTIGIRTVGRTVVGATSFTDLINLKYAVKAYHRANGTFVVADDILKEFEGQVDGNKRPLFLPSIAGSIPNTLLGYPYIGSYRLTAYKDGDVIFGDLSQYIVAMEQDVVIKRSDDYKFRNNVAAFVVYVVMGGKLVQPRAVAILEEGLS